MMGGAMENTEELPSYTLSDPQALIRFLNEAYRQRKDVVIRADDCRYLADTLQERLRSAESSGGSLFN